MENTGVFSCMVKEGEGGVRKGAGGSPFFTLTTSKNMA